MKLEKAFKLQKILTDRFLFSHNKKLVLAGGEEENPDDYLADIFESIDGIGIGRDDHQNYFLQLYVTSGNSFINKLRIVNYLSIEEHEIALIRTPLFQFHSKKERPLKIGCSVGHISSSSFGTLGCFVTDGRNNYLLSNHHVLFDPTSAYEQDFIIQPGKPAGTSADIVGPLYKKLPFDQGGKNRFDAALAGPLKDEICFDVPVNTTGNVCIAGYSVPSLDMKVYKYGAFSTLTFGLIESLYVNVKVYMPGINRKIDFTNQVMISSRGGILSHFGDSGSVFVDQSTNMATGLLFAGNGERCLANPIDSVLNELQMELSIPK
jgi:hypothetical protein